MNYRLISSAAAILALVPTVCNAGLINTPPSSPPLVGSGPGNRPAPPAITTNFVQTSTSGWKLQIGQQYAGAASCGSPGKFFARVSPGQNGQWTYRFVRSDGTASAPVTIPAAPEIGGHWAQTTAPFGKEVSDETVLRGHVNEWFEVQFEGKTLQSPTLVEICR